MTVLLSKFMSDLVKEHQQLSNQNKCMTKSASKTTTVFIIDDNPKLTQEAHMRNSISFKTSSSFSSSISSKCHLNNRWSSQPSIQNSSLVASSTHSTRRSSYSEGRRTIRNKNWRNNNNTKRRFSDNQFDSASAQNLNRFLDETNLTMQFDRVPLSTSQSLVGITPRCPKRLDSPLSFQKMVGNEDFISTFHDQALKSAASSPPMLSAAMTARLREALGSMAPVGKAIQTTYTHT